MKSTHRHFAKKFLFITLCCSLLFIYYPIQANAGNEAAVFGTKVHSAVTALFKLQNSIYGDTDKSGKPIPGTYVPPSLKNSQKPDFVLDSYFTSTTEIYELKPTTYMTGTKFASAVTQLGKYKESYEDAFPLRDPVISGKAWNPNGLPVIIPGTNKAVLLLTQNFAPLSQGLIFYKEINIQSVPEYAVEYYTVKDKEKNTYTVIAQEPKTGLVLAYSMVAGGLVLAVGTIVEDAITLGGGIADDPITLAAAYRLISGGLAALPMKLEIQYYEGLKQFDQTMEIDTTISAESNGIYFKRNEFREYTETELESVSENNSSSLLSEVP